MQFRGIKIIYQYSWNGKPLTSADEDVLHDELGIVLLKYRRIRHLLIVMFDLKSRHYDLLDSYDCGISLRSSSKVKFDVAISGSDIYGKSFYVCGVKYWNRLPTEIQNAPTKLEFKQLLTLDIILKLDDISLISIIVYFDC